MLRFNLYRAVCVGLLCLVWSVSATASETIIRSIHITGLKHSSPEVVLRELPFAEGEIWQPEYAELSERRLRYLGIFDRVVVLPPTASGQVNIQLSDLWPVWLLPNLSRKDGGASSAGLTLTDYNMWGMNHVLRLSGAADTGNNFSSYQGNSTSLSYLWRRVNNSKLSMDVSVTQGKSSLDVFNQGLFQSGYEKDTHDIVMGVSYGFGDVPGEGWDMRFGTSLSDTQYKLMQGPVQADVKNRRRNALVTNMSYTQLDNHITWFSGSIFDYTVNATMPWMGSTIQAVRQSLSWRRYIPLKQSNDTINFRLNAGWTQGDILRDGLFDLGEGRLIRGYYPGDILGSAYVFGTAELRTIWEAHDNIQWVTFLDAAHVNYQGKRALGTSIIAGMGAGFRWTFRWLVNGTLRADIAYGTALQQWRIHVGAGQSF